MTETTQEQALIMSGQAPGLIAFLGFAERKGYLGKSNVGALRTGVKKVLEVESEWTTVDIRHLDVDDLLLRFRNRNKGSLTDASLRAYEVRFRQAVEMYRKYINHEDDWLPSRPRPRAASSSKGSKRPSDGSNSATELANGAVAQALSTVEDVEPVDQSGPVLITYPFPIRRGVQGKITLPEDLTEREAKRIAAFVATLVSDGTDHEGDD